MGEPFRNLYAIRFGHFKTYQVNAAGEQQITGFQMAGELLGMDAISGDHHQCDAVALEDSEASAGRRSGRCSSNGIRRRAPRR